MFQLQQIKDAHSKVKSGTDFPYYIQTLKSIGVIKYNTYVNNGRATYYGVNDFEVTSAATYKKINIANISDKDRFKHYLKNHQRGQTDYQTFCEQAAATGVEKWTVSIIEMTCTYFNKYNAVMLLAQIPIAKN